MNRNVPPVHLLFSKMRRQFPDYPPEMIPVPFEDTDGYINGVIEGTSFFPGGWGFVKAAQDELPDWPDGKVMVIGNDWGDECSFLHARKAGHEATGSTWRGILALFPQIFGDLHDCFFTNAFMGLREGRASAVGECPGRRVPTFKKRCREFLEIQLREQRPRLILTLGKWVPDMLSDLAPKLAPWRHDQEPTWRTIDKFGPLQEDVVFHVIPQQNVVVCALTHPDRGWLNYKYRNYGPYHSELGLLRAAVNISRLTDHGVELHHEVTARLSSID